MQNSEEEPDAKARKHARELLNTLKLALKLSSKNVAWADDARTVIAKIEN